MEIKYLKFLENYKDSLGLVEGISIDKIDEGQTNRVVINLENWTGGTLEDLTVQFKTYEIPNLNEVILIDKGGNVSNLTIK